MRKSYWAWVFGLLVVAGVIGFGISRQVLYSGSMNWLVAETVMDYRGLEGRWPDTWEQAQKRLGEIQGRATSSAGKLEKVTITSSGPDRALVEAWGTSPWGKPVRWDKELVWTPTSDKEFAARWAEWDRLAKGTKKPD